MTTLIGKVQETSKRLQQLTVWRPTDRDPYFELDRWRTDAHRTIEQIYQKKRQQIEQLTENHEREFMRQIARQRALLTGIRTRLVSSKDIDSSLRAQHETSIFTDLQKLENDINTRLGRAEIDIATTPISIEHSVCVSLKKYLSANSPAYVEELPTRNQTKKPTPRSKIEVTHVYEIWRQEKQQEEILLARKQSQSAREYQENLQENRERRRKDNKEAHENWVKAKKSKGAFTKKRLSIDENEIKQETEDIFSEILFK